VSPVGSGVVLSGLVVKELERLRVSGLNLSESQDAFEKEIAEKIAEVLTAEDASAHALRSEIAAFLHAVDAGPTVMRAVVEQDNEQARKLIAALAGVGSSFAELDFLIRDLAREATAIQRSLDTQGADVRAIIEQNTRQAADIRLVREELMAIGRRTGTDVLAGRQLREHRSPYRGLMPFDEADADFFYGRERLAAELAAKVTLHADLGGIILVTGASGVGKSSLLRAGLLPILGRGVQVQGSEHWPRIVMTPTKHPLTELAAHLAAVSGLDTHAVRDSLARDPRQSHLAIRQAVLAADARQGEAPSVPDGGGGRLVLIVDQFEQVFTLNQGKEGEAEREAFVTALHAATLPAGLDGNPSAVVVIAVRGDFLDRCAAYPELAAALQEGLFLVGSMTESEIRRAIVGPATTAGLEIEPKLTEFITSDLLASGRNDTAGVLPLLSQAMLLTWQQREGSRLTLRGYGESGGVQNAIRTSADSVYVSLPLDQQTLAKSVLRNMVVVSRDGFIRRPVNRADLYADRPEATRAQIDAIIDAFAAHRLLILDNDTVQISVDALLSDWPRLRGWLEDDQASWILHSRLADAAAEWQYNQRDPSYLYRGTQLAVMRQAAELWSVDPIHFPALSRTQRDFLRASERVTRGWISRILTGTIEHIFGVRGHYIPAASAPRRFRRFRSRLSLVSRKAIPGEHRPLWLAFTDGLGGVLDIFGQIPGTPRPVFETNLANDAHALCLALGLLPDREDDGKDSEQ
jgi:hypothetical protein